MTDIKNELIERIALRFSAFDINATDAKFILAGIMQDYEVSIAEKALTVYKGDENEYYFKKFLAAKAVAGCTKRTIEMYGDYLQRIFGRLCKRATDVTSDDLLIYFAKRLTDGVSKVSADNEKRVLSSFYSWMTLEEVVHKNPVAKISKIKHNKEPKKAFSEMEIELLRGELKTGREKAMFETLLATGCRVSELASIKISDIKDDQIRILGKGEKYRTVYLNAKALIAINNYVAERKDQNPWLFPKSLLEIADNNSKARSLRGDWYKFPEYVHPDQKSNSEGIESIIRRLGKRAGVDNVHPHRFRRTCATFALRRGMPIELVSKMLGHANIATTQIYLDLSETDLHNAHKKYVVQ